jgi:hypothetical protein
VKAIENLERSITVLAEDIQKARLVVAHLIESVHQLIDTHRNHLLPSAGGRIPMEFFALSNADFMSALFLNPEFKVDGVPSPGSSEAERAESFPLGLPQSEKTDVSQQGLSPPDGENQAHSLDLRVLDDAYVNARRNYTNIVRERMLFQQKMDNVAAKRDLIKNLTKSE